MCISDFSISACLPSQPKACGAPQASFPHARCVVSRHADCSFLYFRMPTPQSASMFFACFPRLTCPPRVRVTCVSEFFLFSHARRGASRHAIFKFSLPYMPIILNKSIRIGQAPDALCFYVLLLSFICICALMRLFAYAFKFCALRLTAPSSGAAASFVCNPAMCLRPALIENEHQRSLRLVPLLEDP